MITAILFAVTFVVLFGVFNALPNIEEMPASWETAWDFLASSLANLLYLLPTAVATDLMTIFNITALLLFVWVGWITFRTVWGLWVK